VEYALRGMVEKDSMEWSYKRKHRGRKFLVIMDAQQRIRYVIGEMLPKVHDSWIIDAASSLLEEKFQGGVIIADTTFHSAKEMEGVRIIASAPKAKRRRGQSTEAVTAENRLISHRNKKIHSVRSTVESPFGLVNNEFKSLKGIFNEDSTQLKYLVFFAFAVHNYRMNN